MQYKSEELQAQQIVLAFLGFYKGKIDGIWSEATIKAKQAFECEDSYLPAAPTFGLPFSTGSRLPKGLRWESGFLTHVKLTMDKVKEIMDTHNNPPRQERKEQHKEPKEQKPEPKKEKDNAQE